MSSETLHEDANKLTPEIIDHHRAIVSLMEELEAVDWYNQRARATSNRELRAILEHNRDEEKEHAAMALEWLRRADSKFAEHLKTFLFTDGPITQVEAVAMGRGSAGGSDAEGGGAGKDGSLGIGGLKSVKMTSVTPVKLESAK